MKTNNWTKTPQEGKSFQVKRNVKKNNLSRRHVAVGEHQRERTRICA